MDAAPLIGLAGLILVKEAGIPIPVPGDLVVIGAGVAASRGDLDPVTAVLVLIGASVVGGSVQFALLRSVARPAVIRLLGRLGGVRRIDDQTERVRRRGAGGVAVARVTPGIRIVAIAASALAAIPAPAFLVGLIAGNAVFITAHFGLGLVLGEPVLRIVGGTLGALAGLVLALAVLGAIAWAVVGRRRRQAAAGPSIGAWTDACCPACGAVAAIGR